MKKNYLLSGLFAMAMTGMALISCTDTDEPGSGSGSGSGSGEDIACTTGSCMPKASGSAALWQPHKIVHKNTHSSAAHTPLCLRPPGRGFILVRFSISPTTRLF